MEAIEDSSMGFFFYFIYAVGEDATANRHMHG